MASPPPHQNARLPPRRGRKVRPAEKPDPPQPALHLGGLVAIITGAGRGIGRSTAELFAREGARVVLCSRTRHELGATLAAIESAGGEAVGRRLDIGVPRQAQMLVDETVRRYGRLDLLINNAGILGPRVSLTEYPLRDWREVLRINLSGTFYVSREAARIMERQRSGCIISISSSVGRQGRAGWGAYAVSKFGVEGLTQVLAEELRSFGVRVLTFNPGGTWTSMRAAAYPEENPLHLRPPEVPAQALLRLVLRTSLEHSGGSFNLQSVP